MLRLQIVSKDITIWIFMKAKHTRTGLIYVVLFLSYGSLGCPEIPTSSNKLELHNGRCCVAITCNPGYKPKTCEEGRPKTTECIPCPEGEFMAGSSESYLMRICSRLNPCKLPEQRTVVVGDRTQDYQCECDREGGYVQDPSHSENCIRVCPAGEEMDDTGRCIPCQDGYFKPVGEPRCIPCSKCGNDSLSTMYVCNKTQVSICDAADVQTSEIGSKNDLYWLIVLVILPVIVCLIVCVTVHCRRKCRNQLADDSKKYDVSPETKDGEQREILMPVSDGSPKNSVCLDITVADDETHADCTTDDPDSKNIATYQELQHQDTSSLVENDTTGQPAEQSNPPNEDTETNKILKPVLKFSAEGIDPGKVFIEENNISVFPNDQGLSLVVPHGGRVICNVENCSTNCEVSWRELQNENKINHGPVLEINKNDEYVYGRGRVYSYNVTVTIDQEEIKETVRFVVTPYQLNELIKNQVRKVYPKIAPSVDPNGYILDQMFSERILNQQQVKDIRESKDDERCRKFFDLLFGIAHPYSFIFFRKSLEKDYSWLVTDIDYAKP